MHKLLVLVLVAPRVTVVMLAHPSLKHIQRCLVTFLRFIQRVLGSTTFRKLCTALFRRLVLSFHFLLSRSHNLCKIQWRRVDISSLIGPTHPQGEYGSPVDAGGPESQIAIPLNNIACSLYYASLNEPAHEDPSSSSSQTLSVNAPTFLQSFEMLPLSRDRNTPTSSPRLSHISISMPDEPIYTTTQPLASSPITEIRRPPAAYHHICGYRSDSRESRGRLGSVELSNSRYRMRESSHTSIDLSRQLSHQETLIPSPTSDLEAPILSPDQISPVAPENFQRYEKRRKIPDEATTVTINPFCTDFSDYYDVPGWSTCTHPEGGRYFHNAEKRIFTDADLYDPACLNKITEAIRILESLISKRGIQISEKTDLVLDLNEDDDGDEVVDYYFADHELRIVVFLDKFPSNCLPHWFEVKGVNSGTHLRHALEIQYWWHCSAYPNCIELSHDLICELRATVMHFIIDCRTSSCTTSPYTLSDLQQILTELNSLKDNAGKPYSGCISFSSRLMYEFGYTRFLNFFGQPEARLNRVDSVHGHCTNGRTWFIKSISIFLLSAPDVHRKNLQQLSVDGVVHTGAWEASIGKVTQEWRDVIINATILLNANVGFLAINSVDTNRDPYRSPAQISSYLSIIASIGSIILGLVLVRQDQTKSGGPASVMLRFSNTQHLWLGRETLAIMFSLPYALLMYGTISFLIAFWFMCLQDSSAATRSLVVALCGVILIFIVWCIWTAWEKQEPSSATTFTRTIPVFEEDHANLKPKDFKFERDKCHPKPQSTRHPARGWSTILTTILEAPKKIRRGT